MKHKQDGKTSMTKATATVQPIRRKSPLKAVKSNGNGNGHGAMRALGSVFVPKPTQVIELPEGKMWVLDRLDATIARGLLDKQHPGQRPVDLHHVDAIAKAMTEGKYQWTADPIRLDDEGQLIDGQHRLSSVIQSDSVIRNVLIAEINGTEVHKYLDTTTKTRSLAQVRGFMGLREIPKQLIAAILYEFCDFMVDQRRYLTKPESIEIVEDFPCTTEGIELYTIGCRKKMKVNAGVLAGALRCVKDGNRTAAVKFFSAAFGNVHQIDGRDEPIVKLFADYLITSYAVRTGVRAGTYKRGHHVQIHESAEKAIRAYNAYRAREPIHRLVATGKIEKPIK